MGGNHADEYRAIAPVSYSCRVIENYAKSGLATREDAAVSDTPAPDMVQLFDPNLPPSGALLFYLFAELVVRAARFGTKAPFSGARVSTDGLASALFAVSIWQLRDAGLVRLEPGRDSLRIARTSMAEERRRDSIEGGLLDVLTPGSVGRLAAAWEALPGWVRGAAEHSQSMRERAASLPNLPEVLRGRQIPAREPPVTVTETVTRWYGSAVTSPEVVPVRWAQREAIAKGYLSVATAKRNPLAALFLGKTVNAPVQEKIASAEPAFVGLFARWQAFQANEAALYGQLQSEVSAAILASLKTSDSTS